MPQMTPEEILQIHKDYADQFASLAQSGLASAFSSLSGSGIFDYRPTGISITFPEVGNPKSVGELPELPDDPTLPTLGALKDFVEIPNVGGENEAALFDPNNPPPPSLEDGLEAPPIYTPPPTPPQVRDFTATPPNDPTAPTLPPSPSFLPMPTFALPYDTFVAPTKPVLNPAVFEGQRPQPITLPDPNALVNRYTSEVTAHRNQLVSFAMANADALIQQYAPDYYTIQARVNEAVTAYTDPVSGGGVGIPANVENAIMARASDRNGLEFQRAIATTADTLSKRGFTLPAGVLVDAIRQAAVGMGDAQTRSSTEIATKNLELEQQNFQFMLKLGEELEAKMFDLVQPFLSLSLQIDAQAISYAKEIVATYIAAYNLQVMVYKALYDGYAADAEVFKARIAANEALVRQYEAEIRAELAKAEIDTAYVNMLRACADANLAIANTYKVQVDAALAPLEIARIQLGIFEARARAYAAEVGAYEARWRGYVAQVEGELGKFKAYSAQAEAFVAQVQAEKAKIERDVAKITAAAETNRTIGQHNDSVVRVYTAQADAAIKVFDGQVAGFSASSNSIIKQSEIEVEFWRAKANLIFQEFNVAVQQMFEYAREQMNLFRGQMEAAINAANGLAHASQVAGNLAGQAMGGLTSFAGVLTSKEG